MCYGDLYCVLKSSHQKHLCSGVASNYCAEARGAYGRDVVLAASECSGPRSGKMSSTPLLSAQQTTPPAAAAASYTSTATSAGAAGVTSITIDNTINTTSAATEIPHFSAGTPFTDISAANSNFNGGSCVATVGSVAYYSTTTITADVVDGSSLSTPHNFSRGLSPCSRKSSPSKSLSPTVGLPCSSNNQKTSSITTLAATPSTLSPKIRENASLAAASATSTATVATSFHNEKAVAATALQTEQIYVNPKTQSSVILIRESSSLLVPSVCWEESSGETSHLQEQQQQKEAISSASYGVCAETRPPVLGEEQRTGREEDIAQIMSQGDGWGECPAVVGDTESSAECSGGGSSSAELSSSSSSPSNPVEWAVSLESLLADLAGVAVFKNFLDEERGSSNSLDFFFACKGLDIQSPELLQQLLPLLWKKFIRNYNVPVSANTRAILAEKIHIDALSADMFKAAQREVFNYMVDTTYPAFIQSPQYLEQVQQFHQEQLLKQAGRFGTRVDDQQQGYQSCSSNFPTAASASHLQDGGRYCQQFLPSQNISGERGGDPYLQQGDHCSDPLLSSLNNSGNWSGVNIAASHALSTVYENEISSSSGTNILNEENYSRRIYRDLRNDLCAGPENSICGAPNYISTSNNISNNNNNNNNPDIVDLSQGVEGSATRRLSPGALMATMGHRLASLPKFGGRAAGLNPYHANYGRGHYNSRQDSEGQSISSGAHTDDTRSYTDSSLDGGTSSLSVRPSSSSRSQHRKQRVQMKENLRLNDELRHKQHMLQQQQQANLLSPRGPYPEFVVPRTQRGVCPGSNIAKHPQQFVNLLCQKLEVVQQDRDAQEKVQQAFKKLQEQSGGSADAYRRELAVNSLPPSLLINKIMEKIPLDEEDSGQAILDEHVSRVWEDDSSNSSVYSPSSPPRHYPPPTAAPPTHPSSMAAPATPAAGGAASSHPYNTTSITAGAGPTAGVGAVTALRLKGQSKNGRLQQQLLLHNQQQQYQHHQQQQQLYLHQQHHNQQQHKSKGFLLEGLQHPSAAPPTPIAGYPVTAVSMTTSKSWHQARYKEHKGPDVYSTFSSDSGNVADYCDAGQRSSSSSNPRRHHSSNMPKTRSVPEYIMDTCTGSGSDRYVSSSGSRGRTAGSGGAADLTDSGVSVISDSRHSLLTNTNTSSVRQRVETWLQDSSESNNKISSSSSSVRPADLHQQLQHLSLSATERTAKDHQRRSGPSSTNNNNSSSSKWHPGTVAPQGQDSAKRRHRGANMSGSAEHGARPVVGGVPPVVAATAGAPTQHGGDTNSASNNSTEASHGASGGGSTAGAANSNNNNPSNTIGALSGGGSGGNNSNTANSTSQHQTSNNSSSGGNTSDRNTSSSNGSTMRKHPTAATASSSSSAKHGGGGSDSQSSCGRSSESVGVGAESTTVVYSFCDDSVPFVIKIPARSITLKRFKQHLPKRGNYRFFFKKQCDEFGVIQEEMTEDEEILPLYEGRIFAQIRKAE